MAIFRGFFGSIPVLNQANSGTLRLPLSSDQAHPIVVPMNETADRFICPLGEIHTTPDRMNTISDRMNVIGDRINVTGEWGNASAEWANAMRGHVNAMAARMNAMLGRMNAIRGRMSAISGRIIGCTDRMNAIADRMNAMLGRMNVTPDHIRRRARRITAESTVAVLRRSRCLCAGKGAAIYRRLRQTVAMDDTAAHRRTIPQRAIAHGTGVMMVTDEPSELAGCWRPVRAPQPNSSMWQAAVQRRQIQRRAGRELHDAFAHVDVRPGFRRLAAINLHARIEADEDVLAQRWDALIVAPLAAAVDSFGRWRKHFDDQGWIGNRGAAAVRGIELDRAANHRRIGIGCAVRGKNAQSHVRLESDATCRACVLQRGRNARRKGAVPRRATSHRDDFAVFELVFQLADEFIREVFRVVVPAFSRKCAHGVNARASGDSRSPSR